MGIWGRLYSVEELHIANIVQIYLFFQNNDQSFPVEPDCKHTGWKGELAYCRLPLSKYPIVSS